MRRNRFTLDELMQELRGQGGTDIRAVEYAVLETDGKLNLLLYPDKAPATAGQLQLNAPDGGYPHIVVNDGRVLEGNLQHLGLDEAWLAETLKERGCAGAEEIYLMTVNEKREIYLSRKEQSV